MPEWEAEIAIDEALVRTLLSDQFPELDAVSARPLVDWGDVCRTDPAVDLSLVWSLLTPARREAFAFEYGLIDDDGRLRARVLALALCSALAAYGRHEGVARVEREALAGLQRTLVE